MKRGRISGAGKSASASESRYAGSAGGSGSLYKKGYNLVTMVLVPEIDSFGSLQFLKKGEVCAGKSAVLAFKLCKREEYEDYKNY